MMIIYRKSDRKIINGPNTNMLLPEGGPEGVEITNTIMAYGGIAEDYGVFRLHDIERAELVQKCFTHSYTLEFDADHNPVGVIIGDPLPVPEPEPHLPTQEERIEALEMAMLELVLGGGA